MTDPALVRQALTLLGDSADQVAANLAHVGAAGEVNNPCTCPVAAFLLARFPALKRVHVGNDDVCIEPVRHGSGSVVHDTCDDCGTPLPEPVREFVARFDRGDVWPELVKA